MNPASTAPTLTSFAMSFTVPLNTVVFRSRASHSPADRSASRVTFPTAAASGLACATRTSSRIRSRIEWICFGFPFRTARIAVCRASGIVSAISPLAFASST